MSLSANTQTAGDVATSVKRQFGDESGVQITDADIFRWINSGVREIVSMIQPIKATATQDLVSGTYQYSLPETENIHLIETVWIDGSRITNYSFAQFEQIILENGSTTRAKGKPQMYTEFAGQLILWPTPDAAYTGGLQVFYSKYPAPVIDSSSLLGLPDKHFESLMQWCMYKAYELDDEFDASQNAFRTFQARVLDLGDEELNVKNITYPEITIVDW